MISMAAVLVTTLCTTAEPGWRASSRAATGPTMADGGTGSPRLRSVQRPVRPPRQDRGERGGYQITLTNTSSVTVDVVGFSVVFYGNGRPGRRSDNQTFDPTFITQGQSLTWTEQTDAMNFGSDGAVDSSATCQLVQWDHP
jgi:hypothetical protein